MIDMRQTMKYISHNGACDLLVVVDSMSVIKYLIQIDSDIDILLILMMKIFILFGGFNYVSS